MHNARTWTNSSGDGGVSRELEIYGRRSPVRRHRDFFPSLSRFLPARQPLGITGGRNEWSTHGRYARYARAVSRKISRAGCAGGAIRRNRAPKFILYLSRRRDRHPVESIEGSLEIKAREFWRDTRASRRPRFRATSASDMSAKELNV